MCPDLETDECLDRKDGCMRQGAGWRRFTAVTAEEGGRRPQPGLCMSGSNAAGGV